MLFLNAIANAFSTLTPLKSTWIAWVAFQADNASFSVSLFLLTKAERALPISNGNTSGAINSWPIVKAIIFSFSCSSSATAKNVFVSAIILMRTIVPFSVHLSSRTLQITGVRKQSDIGAALSDYFLSVLLAIALRFSSILTGSVVGKLHLKFVHT